MTLNERMIWAAAFAVCPSSTAASIDAAGRAVKAYRAANNFADPKRVDQQYLDVYREFVESDVTPT